jgi:hypothetical protein
MKKLLFLLFLIPAITDAQLSIYAGDSELRGLFGAEAQIWRFSVCGGWRPGSVFPDTKINSWCTALTYYQPIDDYVFYLSGGIASKGISHMELMRVVSEPSFIAMIGTKIFPHTYAPRVPDRLTVNAGVGINTNGPRTLITFECLIYFTLIK